MLSPMSGSGEGKSWAALHSLAGKLLPRTQPMVPRSQWSNLTVHQHPPSKYRKDTKGEDIQNKCYCHNAEKERVEKFSCHLPSCNDLGNFLSTFNSHGLCGSTWKMLQERTRFLALYLQRLTEFVRRVIRANFMGILPRIFENMTERCTLSNLIYKTARMIGLG